jgi:PLP dependent protein
VSDDLIAARWQTIRRNVDDAALKADRDPTSVTVIAVAKKHPVSAVRAAIAAGAVHIGENYVQELLAKRTELLADAVQPQWHFIGHLQRNKARMIAGHVALIHAVDSIELAQEIAKRTTTIQDVLLAINLADEASKSGVAGTAALALAKAVVACSNVRLMGLMTLPPADLDADATRAVFQRLRLLRDTLEQELSCPLPSLSMGMSGDFELAIAEGATHVRIGTAIFGSRK